MITLNGDRAWKAHMDRVLLTGHDVAPRGQPTLELLHTNSFQCMMSQAVVTSTKRKLNYKFMAAEALWVLSGDNRLDPLTRYVKRMADFSDDGVTLSGAYGPPVVDQLGYVVRCLLNDRDTRQAVMTTWRPRPGPSKDIPCTVAMVFSIRGGQLHQQVFMRSSDVWLGIPYDAFTFSCIGLKVACEYNRLSAAAHKPEDVYWKPVSPGDLTITAASSHLYKRDIEQAREVLGDTDQRLSNPIPDSLVEAGDWTVVEAALIDLRDSGLAPWPW